MFAVRFDNEWFVGVVDGQIWTTKLLRLAHFFKSKEDASIVGGEVVSYE